MLNNEQVYMTNVQMKERIAFFGEGGFDIHLSGDTLFGLMQVPMGVFYLEKSWN